MFKTVEIEINENCNMSCSYCPNSTAQRIEKGEMSDDTFEKLLFQLKEAMFSGNISLHFYGEPLLSPNLEARIVRIKEVLCETKIQIYSNGTLLTVKKLGSLISSGMDTIIVTKHSDSYEKHFAFDDIYKELDEKLKSHVVYKNWEDIKLTNRGGAVDIKDAVPVPEAPCYIPEAMLVITLKGNVLPCFEDYFQSQGMGNIHESSILDIWESEKYTKFRKELRLGLRSNYEICKACNRVEVLTGPQG